MKADVWQRASIKSKANCQACHADADDGTFEDGAMHIPKTPAAAASSAATTP